MIAHSLDRRAFRCSLLMLAVAALCAMQVSCIAGTMRVRAGPTVDSEGEVDFQAGVSFGFGYALTTRSGITGSMGVGGGSRNALELTDTIEYQHYGRDKGDIGYRVGFRGDIPPIGDYLGTWLQGALMYPLRVGRSSGGHEKSFSTFSMNVLSIGLESQVGILSEMGEGERKGARSGFGFALALDWSLFSRMR